MADWELMPQRLFEGGAPLIVWPNSTVSKRTQLWREGAQRRLGSMHGRHGHGPEGQTCRGCVHLVHKGGFGGARNKSFLKCELYNRDGYEGTDWQARWLACGAYRGGQA